MREKPAKLFILALPCQCSHPWLSRTYVSFFSPVYSHKPFSTLLYISRIHTHHILDKTHTHTCNAYGYAQTPLCCLACQAITICLVLLPAYQEESRSKTTTKISYPTQSLATASSDSKQLGPPLLSQSVETLLASLYFLGQTPYHNTVPCPLHCCFAGLVISIGKLFQITVEFLIICTPY